jgi:hypothetical protein
MPVKIVSVRPEPLRAPIHMREPLVMGREEIVWPPGFIEFPPGTVVEVEDRHAPGIIEYFGMTGVVVLRQGETPEDAIQRAKMARVEFLTRQVIRYREDQAMRTAQQLEPLLPAQSLRELFKELGDLRKDVITKDPLMTDALPLLEQPVIADPMKAELEAMGIPIESVPLVPKVIGKAIGLEV